MATFQVNQPTAVGADRVHSAQWGSNKSHSGSNNRIVSVTDDETNQVWDIDEAITATFFRIGGGTIDFEGWL